MNNLNQSTAAGNEDFAAMLEESFGGKTNFEGKVTKGCVVKTTNDFIVIDVGLKSEGLIPRREFTKEELSELRLGDIIDVYVERIEDQNGDAVLSREKARREEVWVELEKVHAKNEPIMGVMTNRVKGGFTVDIKGVLCFLPGSQVDVRPIRDMSLLLNISQPFIILKMDRPRGNIIVSRRAILEESRAEARSELLSKIKEGDVLQGIVKNVTDYGAFVDLGGVDGLVHSSDISWNRLNHPSDALKVGDSIEVKVIKYNEEDKRISLGIKQLSQDPWHDIEHKFPIGKKVVAEVTNITEYGAFAKIKDSNVEGLIHSSEISWTKKNIHPGKIVSTSQEVEVIVIGIESEKRRISLSLKQTMENPWQTFQEKHHVGDVVEGKIKNITEFGLFIELGEVDGMIHMTDLDWNLSGDEAIKNFKKGMDVTCKILDIDTDKERISLGIKQLSADPFEDGLSTYKKGEVVTCTITSLQAGGIEVEVAEGVTGFIKKSDLSRDRGEQRTDRFAVGEKVDAKIIQFERKDRKLTLSIKAREIDEDNKVMAEYGSSDSGASLGDILGAALQQQKAQSADKDAE